jgi:hypothetical protein
MHFKIHPCLRAGKTGKAPHQTKTPRDQFLVARGANRFERYWNYFGCSFNAAELMQ